LNPAISISFLALRPKSYIEIELLDGTLLTITGEGVQRRRPSLPALNTNVVTAAFLKYKSAEGRKNSTLVSYSPVLNALSKFDNNWPLTAEILTAFLETYKKDGRSPTTLNEYWTRLNTFFEWSVRQGYTNFNPMRNVPQSQKEIRSVNAVPVKVIARVFKYIQDTIDQTEFHQPNLIHERAIRDLAIFRLAYATGIRRNGIATLEINDLRLSERKVVLRNEEDKEGHGGDRFLSYKAQMCLENWLDIRPDIGYRLFIGTRGNGWNKDGIIKGRGLLTAWKRWQRKAGVVKPYTFHALRHSHVTHSLDNGIPVHHVSAQAGHASPDVTLRIYSDPNTAERRAAYENHNPDDAI
jgi:integrase